MRVSRRAFREHPRTPAHTRTHPHSPGTSTLDLTLKPTHIHSRGYKARERLGARACGCLRVCIARPVEKRLDRPDLRSAVERRAPWYSSADGSADRTAPAVMTFRTKGLNKHQQQLQRGEQDSHYPNNNHRQHRNRYNYEEDGSGDDKTGLQPPPPPVAFGGITYGHPQRLAVQHNKVSGGYGILYILIPTFSEYHLYRLVP